MPPLPPLPCSCGAAASDPPGAALEFLLHDHRQQWLVNGILGGLPPAGRLLGEQAPSR